MPRRLSFLFSQTDGGVADGTSFVWKDNFGRGNNEPSACIGELLLLDKLEPPSLNRVERLNNFIFIALRCEQFSNRMNVETLATRKDGNAGLITVNG